MNCFCLLYNVLNIAQQRINTLILVMVCNSDELLKKEVATTCEIICKRERERMHKYQMIFMRFYENQQ